MTSTIRRTFRRATSLGFAIVIVLPSAAGAAPRSPDPFSPADSTNIHCDTGSRCTASATAAGDGSHAAAASVERPDSTDFNESSMAEAEGSVTSRAPEGTDRLRVSFTWRVESAATGANSTTAGGIAVGRVFAEGQVRGCFSCVVEDATEGRGIIVASTYSYFGPVPPEKVAPAGSLVTHSITVKHRNGGEVRPGTRLTVVGTTRAWAYVGGPCSQTCTSTPHSGSASADAHMKLLSITMSRGAGPDQLVLLDI